MTVRWRLENKLTGLTYVREIKVLPGSSEEEIARAVKEDMWNVFSLSWKEKHD